MQRTAYVSGVAALLAALLAGCTGASDDGATEDGANPESGANASAPAEPGRYRTLPEACAAVGEDTLETLLPGILGIPDGEQRERAYAGEPTPTFDNDRKVGCRWKVESASATNHLRVDFERVVSYDAAVSDETEAEGVFAAKRQAANLPEPSASAPASDTASPAQASDGEASPEDDAAPASAPSDEDSPSGEGSPSGTASPSPTALQPRTLDDLGDEAFLNDVLGSSGSTARQRTVTVAFRTSNVIVTVEYEEQPATVGVEPDSEEMQDRARKLAARLDDSLSD
ncbi:DUF3558 domain-containing protein [Streptomyces sp. NPDC006610]|uniref:DUF3558 domain-containing protein n=1 Tax=Streptomyces sp. NPDC006610 TaxID=3154584 RepID=UPI0033B793B1